MTEERRMILEMLQRGEITVEEAQRLLEAVPEGAKAAGEIAVLPAAGGFQPKRLRVLVTEGGRAKVNIRLPFSLVRAALKMGLSFGALAAKHCDDPEEAKALSSLKDLDIDELLKGLDDGEITLPYALVDVDDEEGGGNVQVYIE